MEDLKPIAIEGISNKKPVVIAGPCSAETEEQVMSTAKNLAANGVKIYRAGIWKPRTKPGGFEGIGVDGLAWLKAVKKETGMLTATEVATAKHVYEALKAGIDILWIGARTTANPFAVQEIADALKGADVPVLERIAVTHVPIFCPKVINTADCQFTIPFMASVCRIPTEADEL